MIPDLYSEQDVETKVIVPELIKLGYDERKKSSGVKLAFQHSIAVQQGREKKTIRADVVVFVHDSPMIVVDSKNPRQYLTEGDREQVISYARLIGDIAPFAALCNGRGWQAFDSISKQQIKALPSLKELAKEVKNRRLTQGQRQTLVKQATRTLFAIDSARDLSRLMRRCHDVIRNLEGYDPTKAFDELSKLLFAKMYEEKEVAEGRRETNRFTVAFVKEMRRQGVEIIQKLWLETITSERYKEVFSDEDAQDSIALPPAAIDEIVGLLEDKSLGLTDLDVKGVAFEEFLSATYRGGGLGQYFTPREVVSFMVDLINPSIGEHIIDPSCGSGGFLIRSYDVVRDKIERAEFSSREKQERLDDLANSCLVGIDWERRAARTCKMNMIIHGDGHGGVYRANAIDVEEVANKVTERRRFYPKAALIDEQGFDVVLTNPPFGAKTRLPNLLAHYTLGVGRSQKSETLLIERCIRLLHAGGRMAIVIPEGVLSNKNDRTLRNFIREHCIIKAVIRLPQEAFKMSEGAACTSVLYLVKKDPDNEAQQEQGDIFYARAEYIGISPSGRPIEQNDLVAIKEQFCRFEAGEWEGIEMEAAEGDRMKIVRAMPGGDGTIWLEPEVNRTSLLYDRLSFVVRTPKIGDRFSYTFDHPSYYTMMNHLDGLSFDVVTLESLCGEGHPTRGKKPSEESAEGIPIIKVRNVTGHGIDMDTEFAPDTPEIRRRPVSSIGTGNWNKPAAESEMS